MITVSWQTLITIGAILTALLLILKTIKQGVNYVDKPNKNEEAIDELRKKHDDDIKDIKEEQSIMTYGMLASLKGLAELGCDGAVHEAIDKVEKHLNLKAHDCGGVK